MTGDLESERRGPQEKPRLHGVLPWLVVPGLLLPTVLAFFASWWWLADLAVHFRPQLTAVALVATVALVILRKPVACAAATFALVVNGVALVPTYATSANAAAELAAVASSGTSALRIAAANVYYGNDDFERVSQWIRDVSPDVIVLVEVTPAWQRALDEALAAYPERVYAGDERGRGVWMLSRLPFTQHGVVSLARGTDPDVAARVRLGDRELMIFGVHATWPAGAANSDRRNRELAALGERSREAGVPVVAIGDLNVTAYSPHFRNLLAAGRLSDAAPARCAGHTWPTFFPLAGIRIDHMLTSAEVEVLDCSRGPQIGSDHLPVLLTVALR